MTTAYAIQVGDKITINTVHEEARGAMVKWLIANWRPLHISSWSDEKVLSVFGQLAPEKNARLVAVSVNRLGPRKGEQ